ncbi:hypothetical protein GCM10010349_61780 [Streptomyces flavofungini]|nr:hypothetical protein GCM10010349_61780 [Streptomyces flavofungini]
MGRLLGAPHKVTGSWVGPFPVPGRGPPEGSGAATPACPHPRATSPPRPLTAAATSPAPAAPSRAPVPPAARP